jgi:Tol biopolymer transport system component
VFLHDRQDRTTRRVSVDEAGMEGPFESNNAMISGDGRVVAFTTFNALVAQDPSSGTSDIYTWDRVAEQLALVSVGDDESIGNSSSSGPSLSADGTVVAFTSQASNLVASDPNGIVQDCFVRDLAAGTTAMVSVGMAGAGASQRCDFPFLSASGRYIAFASAAGNLVAGDTNNNVDIFVHDRMTGTTERVSLSSVGAQLIGTSARPSISADGLVVSYTYIGVDIVPGLPFPSNYAVVLDRTMASLRLASRTSRGQPLNTSGAFDSMVSADGRYVAFRSNANNGGLTYPIDRAVQNVYVYDRAADFALPVLNVSGVNDSGPPHLSADGSLVSFWAFASNLSPEDGNGEIADAFVVGVDRDTVFNNGME